MNQRIAKEGGNLCFERGLPPPSLLSSQFRLSLSDGTNTAAACQSAPSSTWSDWSVLLSGISMNSPRSSHAHRV